MREVTDREALNLECSPFEYAGNEVRVMVPEDGGGRVDAMMDRIDGKLDRILGAIDSSSVSTGSKLQTLSANVSDTLSAARGAKRAVNDIGRHILLTAAGVVAVAMIAFTI